MKKVILVATLLAVASATWAQEIASKGVGTVTYTSHVAEAKVCKGTGQTDVAGSVAGGAVGAGLGAAAGKWLLGKNGGIAGGLAGAGVGAMLGGGEKKSCTTEPAYYLVDVQMPDKSEASFRVTDPSKCLDLKVCYPVGHKLQVVKYKTGEVAVR